MPSAIAFCPSPPLLVPDLAAGAAAELDPLRAACREAVRRLLATGPDEVVVIGAGPETRRFPPGTVGTLAGYGVPVTARLPGPVPAAGLPGPATATGSTGPAPAAGADTLPLALTLGAWLLAGAGVPCSAVAVDPGADPAAVGLPDGAAYLVVGDGSARRSERAPGYVDPRAEPFDAAVEAALASGDAAALRDLDPALGADLLAAGVPAWRAVGHAAGGHGAGPAPAWRAVGHAAGGHGAGPAGSPRGGPAGVPGGDPGPADGRYEAEVLYAAAPYGVGYFVATWVAR